MAYDTILFEQGDDHVATITINRPASLNAFNEAMVQEFADVWRHVRVTDDIHAVVLRAAPGRAFSTGVDVKEGLDHPENPWSRQDPGGRLGPKQNEVWKPVICAVHGMAAGGAFYWINESDIVICSEDATFFDPHVTFGMVAALEPIGLSYRLLLGDVIRMALLGNDERISARSAYRMGLVSEVVEPAALWPRAHALARTIAAKPPAAVQGTVRAIWESLDKPRNVALAQGILFPTLGNPIGQSQVDRWEIMRRQKSFDLR